MFEYLDSQRIAQKMISQAKQNHGRHGDQDRYTLMTVLMEEVGEVSRAILDHDYDAEKDCFDDIQSEIIDTGAVLLQLIHEVNREKQNNHSPQRPSWPWDKLESTSPDLTHQNGPTTP